jgi:hypothetical protein
MIFVPAVEAFRDDIDLHGTKDYFTSDDAFASDRMLCGAIVSSNKIASERQHQPMRINQIAEKITMLIKK